MASPKDFPGRCGSCGFLAIRVVQHDPSNLRQSSHETFETTAAVRFSGIVTISVPRAPEHVDQYVTPFCFVGARQLAAELDVSKEKPIADPIRCMVLFADDRNCEAWTEWIDGLSPKEHWEQRRMVELDDLRREQAKMIADVQTKVLDEQLKIAKQHARATEALNAISERQGKQSDTFNEQTAQFNRQFKILTIGGLVIAGLTLVLAAIQVVPIVTGRGAQHVIVDTPTVQTPTPVTIRTP
ncbi:MAG: hypothetical protein ACYDEB_04805 [Dehalococcoidia bacterium]